MTVWCRINRFDLPLCDMKGQDTERIAGVLSQYPTLVHLDLSRNYYFGDTGAKKASVKGWCVGSQSDMYRTE